MTLLGRILKKARRHQMNSSTRQAMSLAKRPLLRKIYYWGLGIMSVVAGWGIAYTCIVDYWKTRHPMIPPLIVLGLLLPVIIVGGERYRFKKGAKEIRCVRCRECNSESSLSAIYKTGRCPECGSKRIVGVTWDGITI